MVVRRSPLHGRGVFAARDIMAGEVLAQDPVLVLPETIVLPELERHVSLFNHPIGDYLFVWETDGRVALALGVSSLANEARTGDANAKVCFSLDGPTAQLLALRDIETDEEILHEYGPSMPGSPTSFRPTTRPATGAAG